MIVTMPGIVLLGGGVEFWRGGVPCLGPIIETTVSPNSFTLLKYEIKNYSFFFFLQKWRLFTSKCYLLDLELIFILYRNFFRIFILKILKELIIVI